MFVSGANEWGTICDDHWDNLDARVVCRQLGYYGGKAVRKAAYGSGDGPIWFDNMKCNGSEKTLFQCEHRGIGTHNCNHKEDVGVICESKEYFVILLCNVFVRDVDTLDSSSTIFYMGDTLRKPA